MARWKGWLLPALLAAAQLAYWPFPVLGRADPTRVTAAVAIIAVVCAGLVLRRTRPLIAVAVVAVGLALGVWATPQQEYFFPGDALLVLSVAESIALFHVALRSSRRATLLTVAGLLALQAVLVAGDEPLDLFVSVAFYALVAAGGRVRRRWLDDRDAAAHRLEQAERARVDAAAAEQRRLARELHDVSAHHLTSIVVNASAAQFIGTPQLRAESLEFAARTGRETLTALHQLVDVLPRATEAANLADLADDFRQLGQVVHVEMAGDPPPAQAEALHGIAREALTNTLRYAPGATVRVSQAYDETGATLVVEDDGAAAPVEGLGSGRGLTGMRERAAALGGTVTAGPRTGGGWQVRAVLPAVAAPVRLRVWLRSQVVLDAGLVLLTLLLPLSGVALMVEEDGVAPAAAILLLLAVMLHSAPLLGRRRHPWIMVAAVALTAWLGPLLVATGVAPPAEAWLFLFNFGAEIAAVYAVAAHANRPRFSWIGLVVLLFSASLSFAVLLGVSGGAGGEVYGETPPPQTPGEQAALVVFTAACAWFALAVPMSGAWLAGWAARRRRDRRLENEAGAVALVSADAEQRARDERARVAAGLQASVLAAAVKVTEAADRGDLDGVHDAAKATLAAMRGLLDNLRPAQEVPSSESV
ncbi:histidine kinase [Actinoplanes sp. TRM 88003]|uniref:histidine kinase n=1 Tax=Paractinoplanes aksuensis TaxID=2939490 RepID=A0ABT1DHF6_9ACTN|nr:histidine kinase [Actinoplanes aksuensis]MCO8270271.1 histidine kinase [Actinoplanes aksuensis]